MTIAIKNSDRHFPKCHCRMTWSEGCFTCNNNVMHKLSGYVFRLSMSTIHINNVAASVQVNSLRELVCYHFTSCICLNRDRLIWAPAESGGCTMQTRVQFGWWKAKIRWFSLVRYCGQKWDRMNLICKFGHDNVPWGKHHGCSQMMCV